MDSTLFPSSRQNVYKLGKEKKVEDKIFSGGCYLNP